MGVAPSINPQLVKEDFISNLSKNRFDPFKKIFLILLIFIALLTGAYFIVNRFKTVVPSKPQSIVKNFQLSESSPADQDNNFSVIGQPTFVFSKKIGIAEKDLSKYFTISPSVEGSWHLEKNGQVVYFSSDKSQADNFPNTLAFNTVYTVTINKNLPSNDNQQLTEDAKVVFRTKQNPLFGLRADKKLISIAANQPADAVVKATFYTDGQPNYETLLYSPVTVSVQKASAERLLKYFSYKEGNNPLYQFETDGADVNSFNSRLQSGTSTNNYFIDLKQEYFSGTGLYFVTVKNKDDSEDFFVSVSNHIAQVFSDNKGTYIWITGQDVGKGVGGISAQLYKVKNSPKLIDTVVTGNDGIANSKQPVDVVDFVITKNANDLAVTFTKTYGSFGGYSTYGGVNYHVYSYSDRPVYHPGDTVHYKAVLRKQENGNYAIPEGTFYTQLLLDYGSPDPSNYKPLNVDQNGTVTVDLTLPQMVAGSYPQITLSTKNADGTYKQIDSLPVVVQSYRKPDMDITAVSVEKEYISSDSAHLTVSAKTNYGQPLTNADFSYRVLVSDYNEVKNRATENIGSVVSGFYGSGDELISGTGRFNEKGTAQITFSTTLSSKYELSQIATLEITPNIGASPSIGKIARLIHRGEFALFIDKLTGDTDNGISGTVTALDQNIPRGVVAGKQISLSLYKIVDYNKKQLIQSQNAVTGPDGSANLSFQKVEAGNYDVVAQRTDNRSNTVTTRQQVYVGQKVQATSVKPQYSLDIKTSKTSYKPNETANIAVTANFPVNDAVVAITNNGSSIVSFAITAANSSSFVLPVLIREEYGQGIGVDIYTVNKGVVVRGYANIGIDQKERKIVTSVTFDKQIYKPGDNVSATVTTKDQQGNPVPADNSLAVIDASILQIGQLNGNIFDSFYGYTPYSSVLHYDSTEGISRNLQGGGGGCFLEGTKISMGNGTYKNIEDVRIGDKILTKLSDSSPVMVADAVTATFRHNVTDYLTINGNLNVTWIHRIYLNGSWQEAKNAKVGDFLLDENGNQVKIASIVPHTGQFSVYNLTTARQHTFFADGFYVHNDKGPGPRQNFADTAYWNPHIQTDSNGKATVSFKLPDNVTTFTAQVFSNTRDSSFGQSTADFISQKDFNIIPAVANFYYQGDKPVISALVQNSSQSDIDLNVFLSIKELGFTKSQLLHINKGDFAVAEFPVEITAQVKNLSFLIEAKDVGSSMLDSVLITKQVLPVGNIVPSWMSFTGSKNVTLTASYPALDFNNVSVSIVPSIASGLFNKYAYFNYQPAISAGQDLFAYSYILARTRDSAISPTSYSYAQYKNNIRELISDLMRIRAGNYWNLPPYSGNESFAAMNLWITFGLEQAQKLGIINEINNISSIVNNTRQYIRSSENRSNLNREEQIARQWVLNEQVADESFQNTPEAVAIRLLNGENALVEKLRSMSFPSAGDRYIWDSDAGYAQVLPALAMMEKGTKADAEKAIKGLSFVQNSSSFGQLAIMAGIKFAEKNNLYVDRPITKLTVNDQPIYETKEKQQYETFNQSFLAKNTRDGKINLKMETQGDIPFYTTVIQTDYNNSVTTVQNTGPAAILNQLKQWLKLGSRTQAPGEAKTIDLNLIRIYKDQTGADVAEIKQGTTGIVALTGKNPFSQYYNNKNQKNYNDSSKYKFILEDAISPSFIYLNQDSGYGNNPKYQSVLKNIFPGENTIYGSAILPVDYSDETVFFASSPTQENLVLPYVVYNVSGGTYYQPKTMLVFPILGLIAPEK